MTKRMLIDSTHAEETRVVVLDGNRLDEFDLETSTKHQLKGNIYLAKVVRVEPSLQAAFVEYGGNRHGFLAFGEIHPDYYQIPVADRKRLLEAQEREALEDEAEEERAAAHAANRAARDESDEVGGDDDAGAGDGDGGGDGGAYQPSDMVADEAVQHVDPGHQPAVIESEAIAELGPSAQPAAIAPDLVIAPDEATALYAEGSDGNDGRGEDGADMVPEMASGTLPTSDAGPTEAYAENGHADETDVEAGAEADVEADAAPEQIGGEHDTEDHQERRSTPRFLRHYKIQEVIRRRQIILIQVVKEERGSKGAALTTYISLAGRFSVLMPNSPRGGGISRKITSAADRRRLKEVTAELDLPRGMGLIVRTAGANRPKPEILRDCEYLLGQWDQIRDLTMKSIAPALIYEEASLIKRAIRDVYSRDVDDILVDGEQGWRAARDFMRMLMPTHARKVQLWKDPQPLFAKAQVEAQLEAMLTPTVQLRSGGYLVINQTEALVAIDVNSGRSTRERGIEETALRTNLEAAEEAARQLRLRDLAGLIVIDFIDMENRRNVASVERRLKEALKHDRARIQVGGISHFGLLEMSRQRLRPSLTETNFVLCPHCGGSGHARSTESAALATLRAIEEEGGKRRAAEIQVHCASSVALYILNHKRQRLTEVEARHSMLVTFVADDSLLPPALRIERLRAQTASELPPPVQQLAPPEPFEDPDEIEALTEEIDDEEEAAEAPAAETSEEREQRRGRRRRRRRGSRRDEESGTGVAAAGEPTEGSEPTEGGEPGEAAEPGEQAEPGEEAAAEIGEGEDEAAAEAEPDEVQDVEASTDDGERRRRGRRGGRRRRREPGEGDAPAAVVEEPAAPPAPPPPPAYVGPTPANPFAGASAFDIFEAIEQAEEQRALAPRTAAPDRMTERMPEPEPEPEPVVAVVAVAIAPEPELEPAPAPELAPEPEPELGPQAGPVIQPVMIGEESAPAEKKRGWWRR